MILLVIKNFLKKIPHKKVLLVTMIIVVLVVSFGAHWNGMFEYPYYENDEGIYISQAHSLLTEGKLSPYAYWYDHAPFGWITLAVWAKLSGGLFAFGPSVNSGRALMLVLHVFSTLFVFLITRKLSKSSFAATAASLIFALSPLAIYYQRRVLLDNMMIFWVLLSMTLLLKKKQEKWQFFVSAGAFALGALTKESAAVFFPAFLYLVHLQKSKLKMKWPKLKWIGVAGLVGSLYPLYALFRGELFPKGFLGDNSDRLSLIDTLLWQAQRGSGLPFWNMQSEFFLTLQGWFFRDPYLTVGGIVVSLIVIGWSFSFKRLRVLALALFFSWAFLLRGKLVFNFYIIPLVPLVAISAGIIVQGLANYIGNGRKWVYAISAAILLAATITPSVLHSQDHFNKNETAPQVEIVRWIKQTLPQDSEIAIDDYAYADYHDGRFENRKVFAGADTFWKLESDPQVRQVRYGNDWKNIDYIASSNVMEAHLNDGQLSFVKDAFLSSRKIRSWRSDNTEYAYRTSVRKVDPDMILDLGFKNSPETKDRLYRSFRTYKKFFFRSYGEIVDPDSGITTSEGQSYAMLRAVWLSDKEAFDGSWEWTRDHLQFREDDNLISWKWVVDKLEDSTNASDADEDIALALLFAYKQWGDEAYLEEAKKIIFDLGEHVVYEINGTNYFLPSHWESIEQWNGFLFNPSYLSPATYRIFAEVDPDHDWEKTANDSYKILNRIGQMSGNATYLPADWLLVDKETGDLSSANEYFDYDVDRFSFDGFRTLWRVSLDYQWFQNKDAKDYIEKINAFLTDEYEAKGKLPTVIMPNGEVVLENSTLSIDAGYLAALMLMRDHTMAEKFYQEQFEEKYNDSGNYWGDDKYNYYNANWAWFGTAMYNGDLKNLWAGETRIIERGATEVTEPE